MPSASTPSSGGSVVGLLFLARHHDLTAWMTRPTSARLADLHRVKAWPLFTWLVVDGRLQPDLELLLAKPGGVDLGAWWSIAHADDVVLAHDVAERLGWSSNWARQVIRHTAPVVCLWLGKTLTQLTDDDFDSAAREAERVNVRPSTAARFAGRCLALRQLCFQAGIVNQPLRDSKAAALSPAEHAAAISQPDIRRDVIRYAEIITTTLRPATAQMRIKAIRVLADWLAEHHRDVTRLEQLGRSRHIEPFLAWCRTRPWRGPNGNGKTVGMTVFHHDLVDLRVFFEDIAEWGWPTAPQRRLLFLSDLPRLPEPMPRAMAPDTDRAIMNAVAAGIRLPSASPTCCDRPEGRASHPPPNTQRLVAHLDQVKRVGDLVRWGLIVSNTEPPWPGQVQHRPADRLEPLRGPLRQPIAGPASTAALDYIGS